MGLWERAERHRGESGTGRIGWVVARLPGHPSVAQRQGGKVCPEPGGKARVTEGWLVPVVPEAA